VVSRSNKESRPNQSVDGGGKVIRELISGRGAAIDAAVDAASGPGKKAPAPAPAPKNPYKEGSARAKLWARREADKKKE
jgi:hypothetical protein